MNFADPGVWVWQVQNCDWNRVKAIAETGFSWVAIQIVSGTEGVRTGDYADLIAACRDFELEVAGFGWLDSRAVLECEAADRLLDFWGLDGFIANGEKPSSYTQDGYQCPECFGYSQQWVERWKQLRPNFPLAFSSYADYSRADIHYAPWIQAGAKAMPQTYQNEFAWATPERGVAGALDVKQPWNGPPFGWDVADIHPTFANYQSGTNPIPTPAEYAQSLLKTSARGFSVYLGELIEAQDWDAWKFLIPTLSAPRRQPLTDEDLPYTGPYYGPTSSKQPRRGKTVRALKRALHRMGVAEFASPDDRYNVKLEAAMHVWQKRAGIAPASGQYGRGSYNEMRSALAPDGSYAMDKTARDWVKEDV